MKGSEQQQRDRLFIADSIEAKKTERGEERLASEKKKVLSILTPERVPTNRGGQRGGRNVNKSNPKKKNNETKQQQGYTIPDKCVALHPTTGCENKPTNKNKFLVNCLVRSCYAFQWHGG